MSEESSFRFMKRIPYFYIHQFCKTLLKGAVQRNGWLKVVLFIKE
jgi:hypothetical protein